MAKQQKTNDEDAKRIGAECLVHFNLTMKKAGANERQIAEVAQSIAMAITLDYVGTGPGSRSILTDMLNELRKTYLTQWEVNLERNK